MREGSDALEAVSYYYCQAAADHHEFLISCIVTRTIATRENHGRHIDSSVVD